MTKTKSQCIDDKRKIGNQHMLIKKKESFVKIENMQPNETCQTLSRHSYESIYLLTLKVGKNMKTSLNI